MSWGPWRGFWVLDEDKFLKVLASWFWIFLKNFWGARRTSYWGPWIDSRGNPQQKHFDVCFCVCRSFVVIGAPKANTSQSGVTEAGGVFLCPWSPTGGTCDIINFDVTGELLISLLLYVFQEDTPWNQVTDMIFRLSYLSQVMSPTAALVCSSRPSRVCSGLELQ